MKTYLETSHYIPPWGWNDAWRPHLILWWPQRGVWRPHFQSVLRKLCNTDKDRESIGILWNLFSCQTEQSKKFRYNGFSGANLGTFLLQYPKSQMRHNSFAYNSEDLDKVDYEGKYGKRQFPDRIKFWIYGQNPENANIYVKNEFSTEGFREPCPL